MLFTARSLLISCTLLLLRLRFFASFLLSLVTPMIVFLLKWLQIYDFLYLSASIYGFTVLLFPFESVNVI